MCDMQNKQPALWISYVMKFFTFASGKRHDEFAAKLAEEFISNCPVNLISHSGNRKTSNKFNKTINRLYIQAHDYHTCNKLTIYTKARIGNKFMWSLKEAGYDDALIEDLTNGILHALQDKKK